MSNLNLDWLRENFLNKRAVVFDIGCANMNDTINMQRHLPDAIFYAFECNQYWLEQNLVQAPLHNINYHHLALSDQSGVVEFHPSGTLDGQEWPWSGSILTPDSPLLNDRWEWHKPYSVNTISINDFCTQHKVAPSFIHIDVQGAEQKVLGSMGNYRPWAIWAEISEFVSYQTGTTYTEFNSMMESLGYNLSHKDSCDALYIHSSADLTTYQPR